MTADLFLILHDVYVPANSNIFTWVAHYGLCMIYLTRVDGENSILMLVVMLDRCQKKNLDVVCENPNAQGWTLPSTERFFFFFCFPAFVLLFSSLACHAELSYSTRIMLNYHACFNYIYSYSVSTEFKFKGTLSVQSLQLLCYICGILNSSKNLTHGWLIMF